MVRKITSGEYLKRLDNMSAAEKSEYLSRVGEWLSFGGQVLSGKVETFEARLQNILQVSVGWNDQECQAFEDGARLLSALVPFADTWLPEMLYVKSAKRAVRQMFSLLWEAEANELADAVRQDAGQGGNADGKPKEERAEGTGMATQAVGEKAADTFNVKAGDSARVNAGIAKEELMQPAQPFQDGAGDGNITGGNKDGKDKDAVTLQAAVPSRPKHIDQYVHLLPKKTQEHAALVQGLYRELDEARQKLDLLAGDKTASAADREAWAKKVTKCDNTLRKIFDELDAEWANLVKSGRVVVDDLGNARVVPSGSQEEESEDAPSGLTSEQRARRRELRKWLTDTRRGNGSSREARVEQWYENFREYLALEGDAAFEDAKIKEAIGHYGIDVDKLKETKQG